MPTHIGCCGAYYRMCRALGDGSCKGCWLGYDDAAVGSLGSVRNIMRAYGALD